MNTPFDSGYYTDADLKKFGFKSLGENVLIAKNCTIVNLETISIKSNVRIDSYATIISGGVGIFIGNFVHIGVGCYLSGSSGITLEDFSGLSQGVRIYSATDDYSGGAFTNPTVPKKYAKIKRGHVKLQKHVIVGSGSIILPGCTLLEGSSVGALSVIRKSTQAWKVYLGNPAKPIANRKMIDRGAEEILLKELR
ncbi:MAG: acyltransferase [Candidatus Omnitrophica bacterium]|nr:acyltransferase [Candidatus Omnitrophota bacterium]